MKAIVANNINELQLSLYRAIVNDGSLCSPRGNLTKEIRPVLLELSNPRKRITTLEGRKWKLPLAIGELAWNLSKSKSSEFISYYANNWQSFAQGGEIKNSCYGSKIFNSNWQRVSDILKEDIDSRRAIIFLGSNNFESNEIDVSCTNTLQFIVREGRLELHVTMRSNDVYWGLPYDIFLFTTLQELKSVELGLDLGSYFHFTSSMHLYQRHFDKADKILEHNAFLDFEMPKIESDERISEFLRMEQVIRKCRNVEDLPINDGAEYWTQLLEVLKFYKARKLGYDFSAIADSIYFEVLRERYSALAGA